MSKSFNLNQPNLPSKKSEANLNSVYDTPIKTKVNRSAGQFPARILPTFVFELATPQSNLKSKHSQKSTPTKESQKTVKKSTKIKKLVRSESSNVVKKNYLNIQNFNLELEKLLRALYRHCIVCPELKTELARVEADKILNSYANSRLN